MLIHNPNSENLDGFSLLPYSCIVATDGINFPSFKPLAILTAFCRSSHSALLVDTLVRFGVLPLRLGRNMSGFIFNFLKYSLAGLSTPGLLYKSSAIVSATLQKSFCLLLYLTPLFEFSPDSPALGMDYRNDFITFLA